MLTDVSHETILISNDFLILRVSDNLILNNESDKDIVKDFSTLKNSILKKMSSFSYSKESREKENTYLCWIDMILQKSYCQGTFRNKFYSNLRTDIFFNYSYSLSLLENIKFNKLPSFAKGLQCAC